jgi:26S proteasome regulatory subunit N1
MLHHCGDHVGVSAEDEKDGKDGKEEKVDDTFQAFAVLAISLIAMGEEIGAEMALRQFNHLVRPLTRLVGDISSDELLDALR